MFVYVHIVISVYNYNNGSCYPWTILTNPQLSVDDDNDHEDLDANCTMDLVQMLVDNDFDESDGKSTDSDDDSNTIFAPAWSVTTNGIRLITLFVR